MSNSRYSMDMVMERYIGRKAELIKIESELDKLVDKINDGHFSILNGNLKNDLTVKEMNNSPENIKIGMLFKKLFQLKHFELVWVYTPEPQAATPCKTFQSLDKNYGVTEDGVDYNKKLTVSIFIHTGLITHSKMNSGEILAILLHEIGHNFYQSVFQILSRLNISSASANIGGDIVTQLAGMGIVDFLNLGRIHIHIKNLIGQAIDFMKIRPLFIAAKELAIVMSVFTPATINMVIGLLTNRLRLKGGWFDPTTILFNYNVEKHADSFAVDYGYGPQLATALNKLDRRDNDTVYNIPVLNWIMDFDKLLADLTLNTLSGYPTIHNRQTSALKRLKEASKDPNMPKAVKEELNEQIEEFEKYYDNYMSISNDENKKRVFTWFYRSFVNTAFKGNADMREFIYRMDKTHPVNDKW